MYFSAAWQNVPHVSAMSSMRMATLLRTSPTSTIDATSFAFLRSLWISAKSTFSLSAIDVTLATQFVPIFNVNSLAQELVRAYQGGLLLAHGSNYGWLPFLPLPMTHMVPAGVEPGFTWRKSVQPCGETQWPHASSPRIITGRSSKNRLPFWSWLAATARTPAPFMDPADRRRYTPQHSCWKVQGSSSWTLWVDATDLCCLRDLMMMMMHFAVGQAWRGRAGGGGKGPNHWGLKGRKLGKPTRRVVFFGNIGHNQPWPQLREWECSSSNCLRVFVKSYENGGNMPKLRFRKTQVSGSGVCCHS